MALHRRQFLTTAAAAAAAFGSPGDRLNIAAVGVGGVGASYLKDLESENIAFLCDVDDAKAAETYQRYPKAKRYRDYRRMLEESGPSIDAVVVATPDHSHAVIATAAMQLGKHVYCAKPLARTIAETRAMVRLARQQQKKVATQMSVQTCMSDPACSTVEWLHAGAIGDVREAHVWSDRPVWPQGLERPRETPAVPQSLDWDLWLGPAAECPYHPAYHPFAWRGWYDFGTGALGDMGCHAFHVIVPAMRLGAPLRVSASIADIRVPLRPGDPPHWSGSRKSDLREAFPHASIVTYDFDGGKRVVWYDGGLKPPGHNLEGSGILFHGSQGSLLSGFTGGPQLLGNRRETFRPPPQSLQRTAGHYQEWISACKGGPPANCEFGFGGALTELVLLGNLAVRSRKTLEWNAARGITNDETVNAWISGAPYRKGWALSAATIG